MPQETALGDEMISNLGTREGLSGKRLVEAVLPEIIALRRTGRSWGFIAEKLATEGHPIPVSTLKSSVSKLKGKIDAISEARIAVLVEGISTNDAGSPPQNLTPAKETSPNWWAHQPKPKAATSAKPSLTDRQQASAEKFMQRSKRLEEDQLQQ